MQGFGGVVAVVQRELVDRHRWLTQAEFAEDWALAQTLPGANVVNLSMMLGARYFGLRGAVAAVGGMLLFPALVLIALAVLYGSVSDAPRVQGALRGVGAVAAGLIAATGLKMVPTLQRNPLGVWLGGAIAVAAFVAVALLRVPLMWLLCTLGLCSCVLAHWRLGAVGAPGTAPAAATACASKTSPASAAHHDAEGVSTESANPTGDGAGIPHKTDASETKVEREAQP
jgi:chromate transporter